MATLTCDADTPVFLSESAGRWILSAALAAAFCCWQIRASISGGALALPPTFDDVVYLQDAALRLHHLRSGGIGEFVSGYVAAPPHSPLSTFIAMVGFAIFGVEPWSASAANGIALMLILRVFFGVASQLSLSVAAALGAAFLLHPLAGILIIEFRPDPLVAMLTAIGTAWLVLHPNQQSSVVAAAALCGIVLLGKPSIFYLTLLLFGVAFLISSRQLLFERAWRTFWIRAGTMAAVASAVALPHYIIAASSIWNYIYDTIWGARAHVWSTPMRIDQQLSYYLTGKGGRFAQGWWVFAVPVLASAIVILKSRRMSPVATPTILTQLSILLLIAWGFVSLATIKSPFLGLSVAAYVLIIGAVCAIAVAELAARPVQWVLVASMIAFGAIAYVSPWTRRYSAPLDANYAVSRLALLDRVVDILAAQNGIKQATIVQPVIAQYLSNNNLAFSLHQRGVFGVTSKEQAFSTVPEAYKSIPSHYIVQITPGSTDYIRYVPSGPLITQISDLIQTDHELKLIGEVPDEVRGGAVRIYERQ